MSQKTQSQGFIDGQGGNSISSFNPLPVLYAAGLEDKLKAGFEFYSNYLEARKRNELFEITLEDLDLMAWGPVPRILSDVPFGEGDDKLLLKGALESHDDYKNKWLKSRFIKVVG